MRDKAGWFAAGFFVCAFAITLTALVYYQDIYTVERDGVARLKITNPGTVTINTETTNTDVALKITGTSTTRGDMSFPSRTTDPTSPLTGDVWYNDVAKKFKFYDGSNRTFAIEGAGDIGCRAVSTSSQSISTGTDTRINLAGEDYDTNSMHDNVVNNMRVTINTAGKYQFGCKVTFAANTTGDRHVEVWKNGTTEGANTRVRALSAANAMVLVASMEDDLVAGDYLEINVFQTSGGALNVLEGILWVRKVD